MQKQGGRTNEKNYEEGASHVGIVYCGGCGYDADNTTEKRRCNNREKPPIGK